MAAILLVGKTASESTDDVLDTKLTAAGHTVTRRADESSEITSGHDLVIVSESVASGTIGGKYKNSSMPVLDCESGAWDLGGSDAYTGSDANAATTFITTCDITSVTEVVPWPSESVADNVTVSRTMPLGGQTFSAFGAGTSEIAHKNISSTDRTIMWVHPAGGALGGGNNATAKICGFGWHQEAWGTSRWESNLEEVFDEMVDYLIGPSGLAIDLPFVSAGSALFTPVVALGPQSLSLPFISSGSGLFTPTVISGSQVVALPFISAGSSLFTPSLILGSQQISLPFISSGSVLYIPALSQGAHQLDLPFISSGLVLYTLTVVQGPIQFTLAFIGSSLKISTPFVVNSYRAPPLIDTNPPRHSAVMRTHRRWMLGTRH